MTERESPILKRVQLEAPHLGARLIRFNNGLYWAGRPQKIAAPTQITLPPGAVVLYDAYPVKSGTPGVSDLIGWTKDGRFLAIEVKSATGRVTPEQQAFIEAVRAAGGVASVVRSADDLHAVLL